jgi:hypothetical protein
VIIFEGLPIESARCLRAKHHYGGVRPDRFDHDWGAFTHVQPVAGRLNYLEYGLAIQELAARGNIEVIVRHQLFDESYIPFEPGPIPYLVQMFEVSDHI